MILNLHTIHYIILHFSLSFIKLIKLKLGFSAFLETSDQKLKTKLKIKSFCKEFLYSFKEAQKEIIFLSLLHFTPSQFEKKHEEIPDHDSVELNEELQCPQTIHHQRAEGKGQLFPLNEKGWRHKHDLLLHFPFLL